MAHKLAGDLRLGMTPAMQANHGEAVRLLANPDLPEQHRQDLERIKTRLEQRAQSRLTQATSSSSTA
jgi:hypothetical protein